MTCKQPITLYKSNLPKHTHFMPRYAEKFGNYRQVGCGKCSWCRWMIAKSYAVRCELEAREHDQSCFLNLTYAPEHLPSDASLNKKHLQGFIKRLRRHLEYHENKQIRFFGAGEYGSKNGRPHYHVLVFGHQFEDKYHWRRSKSGFELFRSPTLEKLWTYGHAEIGDVSYLTAKYVAGYVRKKQTGDQADDHYEGRSPEFQHASLKPGIGATWYDKNKHWLWHDDQIVTYGAHGNRIEHRPPKYFENLFRKEDPHGYETWKREVKSKRVNDRQSKAGYVEIDHFEDDEK